MAFKKRLFQWSSARLYRWFMRLHSAFPYYFVPTGHAFPAWHYFFEVTRRCNLRCRMCQYKDWFERHPAGDQADAELSGDEWRGLVDQTSPWSLITFTGGEPWVRKDFADILAYASQRRRTHVISNGTLLDEDRARFCVELAPRHLTGRGLCFLGVSIDGIGERHDAIRGREGAFEQTMNGLKALARFRRESGKPCPMLHVTAVIQEENLDILPELPALLAPIGVDALNLTMEVTFPSLEGLGEINPETLCPAESALPHIHPVRLEKALVRTREAAEEAGIELRLPDMPQREILRYHNGGSDVSLFTCHSAWTNLYVGAQGDVYPCFIHKVGNVRENSIASLWNNESMRAFRKRVRKSLFCICQGCCHIEYAGGKPKPHAPHGD